MEDAAPDLLESMANDLPVVDSTTQMPAPTPAIACLEAVGVALSSLKDVASTLPWPTILVAAAAAVVALFVLYLLYDSFCYWRIPTLNVPLPQEAANGSAYRNGPVASSTVIPCYDPSTQQFLGNMPAMSRAEVLEKIAVAKEAAKVWKHSSFAQRKKLLSIMYKYILANMEPICRMSARDSGKVMLDASLSEVLTTVEKLKWLINEGEQHLKPEKRSAGTMVFYKRARVEYHPVGVVGAIVPWNHPFHNVFNPVSAAVFAGNAIVVKVSEHASWCMNYYGAILSAALEAAGAPPGLVQVVTGYGEAGAALVTGGVDSIIFVGSTQVGKKVMAAAADKLTPVTLELGGKDAFIVCEDAPLGTVVPIACKAAFFASGQNCAGGERFFVHSKVFDKYLDAVVGTVNKMRVGPPLDCGPMDMGSMCMPGLREKIQKLVDDAVEKGARVLAGGQLPKDDEDGQFYPPTVIADITPDMLIWKEEVFGPVMSVIRWQDDAQVVSLANDCAFGLSSSVFSASQSRARRIAFQLEAGMANINDFNATYMCQALPFGGVKESGFGRFGGVEGLRALCVPKAVTEDAWPWLIQTALPPMWQYPCGDAAFPFARAMVHMFFGQTLLTKVGALFSLLGCLVLPAKKAEGAQKKGQ